MKTKWHFFYDAKGLRFGKSRVFRGDANGVAFTLEFHPIAESLRTGADESGQVLLTVVGSPEESRSGAFAIIGRIIVQLSSQFGGQLNIHSGLIFGERIADTAEEEEKIRDGPCFVEAHLEECEEVPIVNAHAMRLPPMDRLLYRMMVQFNAANVASNVIDKFLGLFKVLELAYCRSPGGRHMAKELQRPIELFEIGYEVLRVRKGTLIAQPTRAEYNAFVESLVEARHHCAHLRQDGLGVTLGDAEAAARVGSLVEELHALVSTLIRQRSGRRGASGDDGLGSTLV